MMDALLAILPLFIGIGIVLMLGRALEGILLRKTLKNLDAHSFHIETVEREAIPSRCWRTVHSFENNGFEVEKCVVKKQPGLPDSYAVLLLDSSSTIMARVATAPVFGKPKFGCMTWFADGRCLDTTRANRAAVSPTLVTLLRPRAKVEVLVSSHRHARDRLSTETSPVSITKSGMTMQYKRSFLDEADAISKHGLTRKSTQLPNLPIG